MAASRLGLHRAVSLASGTRVCPLMRTQSLSTFLPKGKFSLTQRVTSLFGGGESDEQFLIRLEGGLFATDAGKEVTERLIDNVKSNLTSLSKKEPQVLELLRQKMLKILDLGETKFPFREGSPSKPPVVIFMIGSNGVGKTTTVAKLAHYFKETEKKSVMLCAADTYRAAAVAQLQQWGERLEVPVISRVPTKVKTKDHIPPDLVVQDACRAALDQGVDILLCDTAGRLHNNAKLMTELKKMRRVASKLCDGAPHFTWLVLDATVGSNSLAQAETFEASCKADGVLLSKFDSTAKGGVVLGLAQVLKLPVLFLGTGEGLLDLVRFKAPQFVASFLGLPPPKAEP